MATNAQGTRDGLVEWALQVPFLYEQTPVLADDDGALEQILFEGMSDFSLS